MLTMVCEARWNGRMCRLTLNISCPNWIDSVGWWQVKYCSRSVCVLLFIQALVFRAVISMQPALRWQISCAQALQPVIGSR
jgi:hypothetical protein